jgi:hypothetical protein
MDAVAEATSVNENAVANNEFDEVEAVDTETVNVKGSASINADVGMFAEAIAQSTDGDAEAKYKGKGEDVEGFSLREDGNVKVSGSASIDGHVENVFLAGASSTAGKADAEVEVDAKTVGINSSEGTIKTGSDLILDGSVISLTDAAAISVDDNADATVDLDDDTYAINSGEITVGSALDLDAGVLIESGAFAGSVDGNSTATVKSDHEEISAWDLDGDVRVKGNASLDAGVEGILVAESESTSGAARSKIDFTETDVEGIDANDETVRVKGDLTMNAGVAVEGIALAANNSHGGPARAEILADDFEGAEFKNLNVSGDAYRTAGVGLSFNSDAESTQGNAKAIVNFDKAIALTDSDDSGVTRVGGDAVIDAETVVVADATAATVSKQGSSNQFDNAVAINSNNEATGYELKGHGLNVHGNAFIDAAAESLRSANAYNTQGDARAKTDVHSVIGMDAEGRVKVDGNAELEAFAFAEGISNAFSTGTPGDTDSSKATVDQNQVVALSAESDGETPQTQLEFRGNVALAADADNLQLADAAITNGDAKARTGLNDQTIGILKGDIRIGGDATEFLATGVMVAESNADVVTGSGNETWAADASAGRNSKTFGMKGTDVNIKGNVTNEEGLISYAGTELLTNAEATSGSARALSTGVKTIGAKNVDLDISGNVAGEFGVLGLATSEIRANAAATTGNDAKAKIGARTIGWKGGDIDISGNGNISMAADQIAEAAADLVTSPPLSTTATSDVDLTVKGGQLGHEGISIGGNGNIDAEGLLEGYSYATAVTSPSNADADLTVKGLSLNGQSATISGAGDIAGFAEAFFDTAASSVTGDSTANSQTKSIGLSNGTVIAGPSGGDILGVAGAFVDASSNTTNGHSSAENDGRLVGIKNVDITGGQSGFNNVDGQATGVFNTFASNTNGDATATSHTSARGMQGGVVSNNGAIYGLAELSNTVVATTTTGSATATATGSAIGIDQYNIHMGGDGVITGNASVNMVASSSTIGN